MTLFLAYVFSMAGGWLIAGVCVYAMRLTTGPERKFFRPMDLWVGFTERAIATTLVIWAPGLVAAFIGGWVALKMAANWQRQLGPEFSGPNLVALVGNAISFAVAIGAGVWAHPAALAKWAQ